MALTSTSTKNLLNEYHRLAADTLLGHRNSHLNQALLSAAEEGQYDRLQSLLSNPNASLDARCPLTGDTPLIAAARNGHIKVIELLVGMGADLTLHNDMEESALEVASKNIKKILLNSIHHEGRTMSNAQALLQNAWLGDAVSVKKHLSGNHYLDVNCSNSDGMTPLLLVTRDINLFDSIQTAMETEYNPVNVVQDLIDNHADINQCDPKGRSALHFIATSESIHAKKMVSLLMRRGSQVDTLDNQMNSPLHIASGRGHTAIIIALVEQGGADVNSKGGVHNDTPLMLTARAGHSEAARYLLAKGADVTAVDDNGDSALSVATTNSMVSLLKEAWTEQTISKSENNVLSSHSTDNNPQTTPHSLKCSPASSPDLKSSDLSPKLSGDCHSFFLTDQRMSQSSEGTPTAVEALRELGDSGHTEDAGIVSNTSLRSQRLSKTSTEVHNELDSDGIIRQSNRVTRDESKQYSAELHPSENKETKKSHSLPHNISAVLSYVTTDDKMINGQVIKTRRKSKGHAKEDKNLKHKEIVEKTKQRPLQLPLTTSQNHLAATHQKSCETHVDTLKGHESVSQFLPNVLTSTSPHPSHTHHPPSKDKLPLLNNMQAVAMVAVDTEQERFKVHNFGESTPKSKKHSTQVKSRSKSMQPQKPSEFILGRGGLGKSSNDSVHPNRRSDPTLPSKATLLPNVITPQLGLMLGSSEIRGATYAQFLQRGRGRLQPISKKIASPVQSTNPPSDVSVQSTSPLSDFSVQLTSPLSGVSVQSTSPLSGVSVQSTSPLSGVTEILIEPPSQTCSSPDPLGSEDSTLMASSASEFETDSLERSCRTLSVMPSPLVVQSPLEAHVFNLFPPTPGTAHHQANLVINYARQEGNIPLSPIWNRMQSTDTDNCTSSEYITSYIGRSTPTPHVQQECNVKHVGVDSGQGESSDEEGSEGSDESESGNYKTEEVQESLHWKRGRLLGKGAYGKVWEGLLDSAKLIAVKEVELDFVNLEKAQSQYEKIQMEVEILRSLRHRNIVSYLGTSLQEGLVFIFMDYISGGSLQSILKRFGPLDFRTISHYTKQITRALVYLHSNGIIHRDIKGANIMVTSKGVVKLIDFGCAKRYCAEGGGTGMHSVRGTPYWMSPEVICGHGYGRKSDIWSLGCTVHEMAVTKPPWADFPPESALFQIGIGKSLPQLPDHLSPVLVEFLHLCLTREQMDRPSAADLLQNPFLMCSDRRGSVSSNR